jgi:hypothetical protein
VNRVEVVNEGPIARLKIQGAIDEKLVFPDNLNCDLVIVDLEGMTLFNSIGVRKWLTWVKAKKGFHQVHLENCRSNFIRQTKFIKELLPPYVQVKSFYVPYFAPDSGEEVEMKFHFGKEFDAKGLKLPNLTHKGHPLELDVEESYFDFLKA